MSWRWLIPGAFRSRYFEDYQTVPRMDGSGHQTVEYVYTGYWCAWGTDERSAKKHKICCGMFAAASLALYLFGALQRIPFNSLRLTSGLGILSVLFRILEIWGAIALCFGKPYITEFDRELTSKRISFGAALDGVFLLLSAVCGAVETIRNGTLDGKTSLVIIMYVLAVALSLGARQVHKKMGFRLFRNDSGKPGSEI